MAGGGDGDRAGRSARGAAAPDTCACPHADREQSAIDTPKAAFVRGILGKDEFDLRHVRSSATAPVWLAAVPLLREGMSR